MPEFPGLLTFEFWREHYRAALYATLAFIGFLLFLTATFPYQAAFQSALNPLGLRLFSSGQGVALPIGANLYDVRLIDPHAASGRPLLESPQVRVAPALGEMLLLRAAVEISTALYNGDVNLRVWRSGRKTAVSFDASAVDLAVARLDTLLGAAVGGMLTASGDMRIDPALLLNDSGSIEFAIKDASLRIAMGMAPLNLGEVTGKLKLDRGTLEIVDLKSQGGDLEIAGGGDIRAAGDLMDSALDLKFSLNATPDARQRLGALLNLLPHPPGEQPYQLGGTVSAPSLS